MDIHELMRAFLNIDYALVGGGYKHPTYPNTSLKFETDAFFEKYPQLKKDKDYSEFIECYSGAFIDYPNHEFSLSIYGLWSYVVNVLYPDESLIKDNRYFRFAEVTVQPEQDPSKISGISYYFDMISQDTSIYRQIENGFIDQDPEQTSDSFLEWLRLLVSVSGRLDATL